MFAMSRSRRFVSAALPAPSTTTRSKAPASRSKLSITGATSPARPSRKSPASRIEVARPCTTTCEARLDWGLSSTGFMSTVGASPAARAWSAWARPISPPPGHAAALFDMFWGLNGATRSPRRRATRHNPATTTDLPASEQVPWIISAPRFMPASRSSDPAEFGHSSSSMDMLCRNRY